MLSTTRRKSKRTETNKPPTGGFFVAEKRQKVGGVFYIDEMGNRVKGTRPAKPSLTTE